MSISKGFPRGHRCDGAGTARQCLAPSTARYWVGWGGGLAAAIPRWSGRRDYAHHWAVGYHGDYPATTTTTAPPKQPTDDDVSLLGFSQSVELAARNLYDVALGTDDFDDNERAVLATIRESHDAYAASLSAILGRQAPQTVDAVFDTLQSSFGGDKHSVLDAAYALESTAVATHTDVLGKLQATDGASLIASILIVEARHGTVLGLHERVDRSRRTARRQRGRRADAGGRVRP